MSTGHANDWWRPASVCNLTRMLAVDKLVYMDAPPEEWPRRIALNASSTCNLRHNYQCVPGPVDAVADIWIATLWRLSTEHRRPRAW